MPKRSLHKLIPELIPSDLWGRSAYKMLGAKPAWRKKIRPDAVKRADGKCEICGVKAKRLICHDKWSYNDNTATASLVGFEVHCGDCDLVTHFKRAMMVMDKEEVLRSVLFQLCKVNACQEVDAAKIITDADALWSKRNRKKWSLRIAPALVKIYPELKELPNFNPVPTN